MSIATDAPANRGRVGRPRSIPYTGAASGREQLLEAAAYLFTERGFAATPTRMISDRVGIRQASIYYHFRGGKDEILAELLGQSVRPTISKIAQIEQVAPPTTALYLLALVDVSTLVTAPHNIGMLYRLPDVTRRPGFEEFRQARHELTAAYGRLGSAIAQSTVVDLVGPERLGEILIQVVDSVINLRSAGQTVDKRTANSVAAACVRICGSSNEQIALAATAAGRLVREVRGDA